MKIDKFYSLCRIKIYKNLPLNRKRKSSLELAFDKKHHQK